VHIYVPLASKQEDNGSAVGILLFRYVGFTRYFLNGIDDFESPTIGRYYHADLLNFQKHLFYHQQAQIYYYTTLIYLYNSLTLLLLQTYF